MANFLFVLSRMDEAAFFSNMQLDGGPHLIDMAEEVKVFNF